MNDRTAVNYLTGLLPTAVSLPPQPDRAKQTETENLTRVRPRHLRLEVPRKDAKKRIDL